MQIELRKNVAIDDKDQKLTFVTVPPQALTLYFLENNHTIANLEVVFLIE